MELGYSQHILYKHTTTKFHENPSSESRVVPWGQTRPSLKSLFAILRTRIKTRVLATKPFHNNYSTNRGRHSNTKFITGPYELIFTFLNFGRRAVCRSVTLHLDISYGALHITGLTNKQAKRILG